MLRLTTLVSTLALGTASMAQDITVIDGTVLASGPAHNTLAHYTRRGAQPEAHP